ncbi:hypothetical protein L1987_78919 [Smallanthus sonchifolius]|uniref:Uncharacterized protein n=1 Tax=Smallanthus sonchifolius TaxID=185202 RepID=A0ACB8ZE02_9ASTR|nr:hypothetical protein L1987_78919 [Smallanthus sonchifolius]
MRSGNNDNVRAFNLRCNFTKFHKLRVTAIHFEDKVFLHLHTLAKFGGNNHKMTGQSFMEEIDCASFFDHIDDLIEFPPVNDTALDSVECNELPNTWTDNSGDLQVSDPIFCGGKSDNASSLSAELVVPYEDIVQLEWLSNFVEDSFSGGGMTINKDKIPVQKETVVADHQFQVASPVSVLESSSSSSSSTSYSGGSGRGGSGKMIPLSPIQCGPQRARTKRSRPATFNPRAMVELLSPLVLMPVSASTESEKNFTSRCGSNLVSGELDQKKKKKMKKPKMQEENENQNQNQYQSGQGVRKCLHCEITKTPQWRAGPMGPKTLCNACGVRYKSGRLFPEYRPAGSPTFVPTLHSNSHKKVVEMRTKFGPNDNMVIIKTEPEPELIPNMNPQASYV